MAIQIPATTNQMTFPMTDRTRFAPIGGRGFGEETEGEACELERLHAERDRDDEDEHDDPGDA
jgi:hypothetical protein